LSISIQNRGAYHYRIGSAHSAYEFQPSRDKYGDGLVGGLQMLVRVIQGDVVQLYIDTERVYVNQFISGLAANLKRISFILLLTWGLGLPDILGLAVGSETAVSHFSQSS